MANSKMKPTWDYKIALSLAIVTTIISIIQLTYFISIKARWIGDLEFITDHHETMVNLHLLITLLLIGSTITFLFRNLISWILTFLFLSLICFIYGWWYLETKYYLVHILEFREGTDKYIQYSQSIGPFHGATQWDMLVLAVTIVMILWQIRILPKLLSK